ncbi:hypothetical protein F2Q69_00028797 [Brassica cretica]|uniref:Uncharacterized protein n=1 Tax=Brassica cretica TaxID=69181 RepID=A0A8S9S738_BRACR|nr:hypothetical protein F2Q69_00028797 [Brassica cretica]
MDSWSLEMALLTRRLCKDPVISWGPGGLLETRRGRVETQRFSLRSWDHDWSPKVVWEPEDSLIDLEIVVGTRRDRIGTLVFIFGPGGHMGTRRPLRPYRNPEVSSLNPKIFDWNPEVLEVAMTPMRLRLNRGSSLDPEIFDWNPEAMWEPGGSSSDAIHRTQNRVGNRRFPLQIGGLHMDPEFRGNPEDLFLQGPYSASLGETTTDLEGAGVSVVTQVPGFAAFHVWRSKGFEVVLTGCSGLRIPIPALCFIPILILSTCHCGRATFCKGLPESEVSLDLIQLVCPFKYNDFPSPLIVGPTLL